MVLVADDYQRNQARSTRPRTAQAQAQAQIRPLRAVVDIIEAITLAMAALTLTLHLGAGGGLRIEHEAVEDAMPPPCYALLHPIETALSF